jgi:hypothetical protein
MKGMVMWTVAPCHSETVRRFDTKRKGSLLPASSDFLLGLLLDLEDGDDMFHRHLGLSPSYAPRRIQTAEGLLGQVYADK